MRRVTRNGVLAVAASGALAVTMPAYAAFASDGAGAEGSAAGSPGLISGNTVQLPVDVPVDVCGNTVNVVGLLNPAAGNGCADSGEPGASYQAAGASGGTSGSATEATSGGAAAEGSGKDSPGVLSGNAGYGQPQAPQAPAPPPGYGQPTAPPGYGQQPGPPAAYGQQAPPPGYGQQPPQAMPRGAPQGAGVTAALQQFRETPTGQRWTQQNKKLVRVDLGAEGQPVLARQGSMVLYQGKVDFSYKGAGFAGRVVGNATGQEMQLMRCTGKGQVFLAENSAMLHPIELQGDAVCVSAENVLAFDESLQYEVRRIEGHGIPGGALFTMQFQGTGTVVVKTRGVPVVLPVTPTTFADCNAVVAWSAAAQVVVSSQVRMRRNSYAGDTGESVNLQFRAAPGSFVVVQPYEI